MEHVFLKVPLWAGGQKGKRDMETLMCTCPEGYTCGLSWVGRGLGRLIMQKGRQYWYRHSK